MSLSRDHRGTTFIPQTNNNWLTETLYLQNLNLITTTSWFRTRSSILEPLVTGSNYAQSVSSVGKYHTTAPTRNTSTATEQHYLQNHGLTMTRDYHHNFYTKLRRIQNIWSTSSSITRTHGHKYIHTTKSQCLTTIEIRLHQNIYLEI